MVILPLLTTDKASETKQLTGFIHADMESFENHMHYKVIVPDTTSNDEAHVYWDALQRIVLNGKNLNTKTSDPFIAEGTSIVLINGEWGTRRPVNDDLKELSTQFPETTFSLITATDIINAEHFENLQQFSLKEFEDGRLVRTYLPHPIEWVEQVQQKPFNPFL